MWLRELGEKPRSSLYIESLSGVELRALRGDARGARDTLTRVKRKLNTLSSGSSFNLHSSRYFLSPSCIPPFLPFIPHFLFFLNALSFPPLSPRSSLPPFPPALFRLVLHYFLYFSLLFLFFIPFFLHLLVSSFPLPSLVLNQERLEEYKLCLLFLLLSSPSPFLAMSQSHLPLFCPFLSPCVCIFWAPGKTSSIKYATIKAKV